MKRTGPMRFAHRGLCQYAPENTLGAFAAAVALGCEGIELDIHLSKDGVPVVTHDCSLRRLSAGKETRTVNEMTVAEIKATDIPYAGNTLPPAPPVPYSEKIGSVAVYTDEELARFKRIDGRVAHIMTFAEFDEWFAGVKQDVTVEVEMCEDGLQQPLFDIVKDSPNRGRYIFFSDNIQRNYIFRDIKKAAGDPSWLRLGANIRKLDDEHREFVLNSDLYEVGLNDNMFTQEDVDFLRERGIKIFSNLGDYPEWWTAINDFKMDAFKTNYAEAYTAWEQGI